MVLAEIEVSVSHASFATWFKSTSLLDVTDNQATVSVPNIFAKQQLEVKYTDTLRELLKKNGLPVKTIRYAITTQPKKTKQTQVIQPVKNESLVAASVSSSVTLNDKYTFDNFIVGSGNELAYAACQAVAANPGTKYNPLFIYGGVGLGKTHLIQAVGNGMRAKNPDIKIVYISTETFVNEFLDGIRFKKQ